MFDPADLIRRQLTASAPERVGFANGETTVLIPARRIPVPDAPDARVTLAGEWRCRCWPFDTPEARLCGPDCPDDDWERIVQPGKVFYADPETQPAAIPGWDRRMMGHIALDDGAVLRRRLIVPAAWAGGRVRVRFDGVYPAARFYCNGRLLGEHRSGLTAFDADLTDCVTPGAPALLAVRLVRRYEGQEIDMPRHSLDFAGISQEAYLYTIPRTHLTDYHLQTTVDAATRRGRIGGVVRVRHDETAAAADIAVALELAGPGVTVCARAAARLAPGAETELPLALDAPDVALWSDERPALYDATLRLFAAGRELAVYRFRTGFRDLAIRDGRALLNGHPVKFRGVNHLTFHPAHGLHTPRTWLRRNLELMKAANVNAIRTHYAASDDLADLCDELGFYLIQELPIDWWGHWLGRHVCIGPVLMRMEALLRRDRHHVSVVAVSIGNENLPANPAEIEPFNAHMRLFHAFVKALAPDRYTMFPPPGPANKIKGHLEPRLGDVADVHYNLATVRELLATGRVTLPLSWEGPYETLSRETLMARGWSGVWFSSEYGIVNHLPDLHDRPYLSVITEHPEDPLADKSVVRAFVERMEREWGLMRDDPSCLGGAYFPWLCCGAGQTFGWTLWGEDADWGVVTGDLLPKPLFWALRVLFSPVRFPTRLTWAPGQDRLVFTLKNTYVSHDFADCVLRVQQGPGGAFMGVLRDWRDIPLRAAPGETVEVAVPLWHTGARETLARGGPVVCRCHFMDPTGHRAVTADILVVPERAGDAGAGVMPLGPDAVL